MEHEKKKKKQFFPIEANFGGENVRFESEKRVESELIDIEECGRKEN